MTNKHTVYAFRGMPGTGKSTLIKKHDLISNTISMDTFRELISGLDINRVGWIDISQIHNPYIRDLYFKGLYIRFNNKADFIIDNLNIDIKELNNLKDKAENFGFKLKVVDFELKDFDFYLQRNAQREERKRLDVNILKVIYQRFKSINLNSCNADIISVEDFEKEMNRNISDFTYQIDENTKVNHIDYSTVDYDMLKQIENNNEFYVFYGNYFNELFFIKEKNNNFERDKKTFELLNKLAKKDNFIFLSSERDSLLINDLDYITKSDFDLKSFIYSMDDYFAYEQNGQKYFCSCAGVSNVPEKPQFINSASFSSGLNIKKKRIQNNLKYDLDVMFSINCGKQWIQIRENNEFTNEKVKSEYKGKLSSFSLKELPDFLELENRQNQTKKKDNKPKLK